MFFSKITYVSKQTFSTNQFKKTVTEKWTKGSLERQMFSKHIQTFKFISDQKNSNSDQTSLKISPIQIRQKRQGAGQRISNGRRNVGEMNVIMAC